MRFVKKCVLFVLLALFAVSLSACESMGPDEIINGKSYSLYKNTDYGFSLRYPSNWLFFADTLLNEISAADDNEDTSSEAPSPTMLAMWYNFNLEAFESSTMAALAAFDDYDILPELLETAENGLSPLELLNTISNNMFLEALTEEDIEEIDNISVEEIGGNFFLVVNVSTRNADDSISSMIMAVTGHGGVSYIFLFTTIPESLAEVLPVFETMLTTLEFTN